MADVQGFKDYIAGHYPTSAIDVGNTILITRLVNTAITVLYSVYDMDKVNPYTRDLCIYTQANFIYNGGSGMQSRTSLQAQGVLFAGIVKERYTGDAKVPIDPVVESMLGQYRKDTAHVSLAQKERPMQ
ncbi:MAG TPA: hypothetical protein PLH83_15365 [Ruminococcus sp.]|jgi:hypothetical protein|nr:hypothetical protein [Ruminococcus sp.]